MTASLDMLTLKQLEGHTCQAGHLSLVFEKSPNPRHAAARQGGEGFAIPVSVTRADRPSDRHVLKTYYLPTPERRERITFLSATDLPNVHPLFDAAPREVLSSSLTLPQGQGRVPMEGYLSSLIDGERFDEALSSGWDPPIGVRLRLAAQLFWAVDLLEAGQLAHGDIAASNVMILDKRSDAPKLRLIDFDGFYHPGVPAIPLSNTRGGRPIGTQGYRHRSCQPGDAAALVRSDRVAMAALGYELVAMRPDDLTDLERDSLLDQADLDQGRAQVPPEISGRWPAGFALLQRAAAAAAPEHAPEPQAWIAALGTLLSQQAAAPALPPPPPASAGPAIPIRVVELNQWEKRGNLTRQGNSFAAFSPRLAWLHYQRSGGDLQLTGTVPGAGPGSPPLFLNRPGAVPRPFRGPISVPVQPGDQITWDEFDITIG